MITIPDMGLVEVSVQFDGKTFLILPNKKELETTFRDLILIEVERQEKGHICSTFVQMNKGATNIIMNTLLNFEL